YTDAFDLMPLQEALNVTVSTVFTNQEAFGVQNVLIPEGSNLTATQLVKNLVALKYNPAAGEPKALQLTATPAEIFKAIEMYDGFMETLSGINSVARGNPESSLKSGVSLALVQSMAVQFASSFQQSWAELAEDVGSFIITLLKDFANTKRIVALAGKHNSGVVTEFMGSDLDQIERVTCNLGNPMSRTTAGKLDIANTLLQNGMIQNPQQYITTLETGNLEPMLEGPSAALDLIRRENEQMMEGNRPLVLRTDNHQMHIDEH